ARYGPQRWWPGDSPFEIMVGAILTQNTSWKNVEKAIATLKTFDLLDARRLHELDAATVGEAIKAAGTYNVKALRLKAFVAWYVERYGAQIDRLQAVATDRLREELLRIKGVGPETADAILLYALGRPVFVVDAYTYRVATRHGWRSTDATYEDLQELFERRLPREAALYNEMHALLVAVGKDHCRRAPRCEGCPLLPFLPGGVPQAP
ncbi:MAG TPA: endonuclease III domain-containing protein, partial [Planctomycetota bacterium]|nr:endonuclease III domain-containing protein [Planctomycetota bacterium]